MPKVKMLQDAPGSPDGITVKDYLKGREYDLPADLANAFLAEDLAEEVVKAVPTKPKPAANKKSAPVENK